MSLINQMLQDLDARRAVDGPQSGLPNQVRPLPVARATQWPWATGVGLVILLSVAGGWWYASNNLRSPPAPQAVTSAAAVAFDTKGSVLPVEKLPSAANVEAPPLSLPIIPPERRTAAQRMRAERDTGLSLTTSLHLPGESARATVKNSANGQVQPAMAGSAVTPSGQVVIEKSAPSGSPNERADNEYRKAINAVNIGRTQQAIENLHAALKHDVMHTVSRQLLFKLLVEAKQVDEAGEVLQRGLQLQPEQIGWAMSLGRLQVDRGDLPGAWQTLQRSLPAAANSADYQGFVAHVLQRLGRSKEAIEHYQAATRLSPAEGRWWFGLGLTLESDGRFAEAREALLRASASATLSADLASLVEQKLRQLP